MSCRQTPIRASYQGACLCGATFYVFENPPAVAHAQPTCKAYDDLEPDEFLAYLRTGRNSDPA